MDNVEVAWVAGLLEGEGCFSLKRSGASYINCAMTDEDVIRKLYGLIGYGTIIKSRLLPNRKQVWVWRMGAREEVEEICRLLLPLMGTRRAARIQDLLDDFEKNPRWRVPKGTLVHGTRGGYVKGCRCALCKLSERRYREDLNRRRSNGDVGRKGVSKTSLVERTLTENDL